MTSPQRVKSGRILSVEPMRRFTAPTCFPQTWSTLWLGPPIQSILFSSCMLFQIWKRVFRQIMPYLAMRAHPPGYTSYKHISKGITTILASPSSGRKFSQLTRICDRCQVFPETYLSTLQASNIPIQTIPRSDHQTHIPGRFQEFQKICQPLSTRVTKVVHLSPYLTSGTSKSHTLLQVCIARIFRLLAELLQRHHTNHVQKTVQLQGLQQQLAITTTSL